MQRLRTVTSLDVSAVAGHHAMPAALLFVLSFLLNISCNPSLDASRRDGSNEGSKHMFRLRNEKKISLNLKYPFLSGAL